MSLIYSQETQVEIPRSLTEALKTGNSSMLSQHFNSSIEMAIPGQDDIYSKQQAELIAKDFFAKHVPKDFVLLHQGGKEGSQYAIGRLITNNGDFRITLLIKLREDTPFIHQLRFELEQ